MINEKEDTQIEKWVVAFLILYLHKKVREKKENYLRFFKRKKPNNCYLRRE